MKVRVGVQVLVKVHLPISLTCQVTPAPVNFSCHVIALSLARIPSLVMWSIVTQTSELGPRWMNGGGAGGPCQPRTSSIGIWMGSQHCLYPTETLG